jgi:mannitol/fructose-specific phosphotransferase system IIA component
MSDAAIMTRRGINVLTGEMVILGTQAAGKTDAIRQAGAVLVEAGCVLPSYVDGMLAREAVMTTCLGQGIAIPHGRGADLRSVIRTGISVIQLPEGVAWDPGERVYLVVGLASNSDEHAGVLSNLLDLLHAPEAIEQLIHTTDPMVIVKRLTCRRSE